MGQETSFETEEQLLATINTLESQADAHMQTRNFDAALSIYQKIVELVPVSAMAYLNLGSLAYLQGNFQGSLICNDLAAQLDPQHALAQVHMAMTYQALGQYDKARHHYLCAQQLAPEDSLIKLGLADTAPGKSDAAKLYLALIDPLITHYQSREHDTDPLYFSDIQASALCHYSKLCLEICDWKTFDKLLPILEILIADQLHESICPSINPEMVYPCFNVPMQYLPILSAFHKAKQFDSSKRFRQARHSHTKPRIGYLLPRESSRHDLGRLAALCQRHDTQKFEIWIFLPDQAHDEASTADLPLEITVVSLCDMSYYQAAETIFNHQIDYLLDLAGNSPLDNRQILQFTPATHQVHLGYQVQSLGSEVIGYLVLDPFIAKHTKPVDYLEQVLTVPNSFNHFVMSAPEVQTTREAYGINDETIVFANFSHPLAIDPAAVMVWATILNQTPGSALWLGCDNDALANNLLGEFGTQGIDASRLILTPLQAVLEKHLVQHTDIYLDSFLDTNDYAVWQALWHGVPVLTCPSHMPSSRKTGSYLTTAGLTDYVLPSRQDYIHQAVTLASQPQSYQQAVSDLATAKDSSGLFDTRGYVSALEQALSQLQAG